LPSPQNRATPGTPLTVPSKEAWTHVEPALTCPASVIVPVQRPPPVRSPVASNLSGSGAGVFVMPGLTVNFPVGAAGVPPHVQVEVACAELPPPARARNVAAIAMTPIVRDLICPSPFVSRRESARLVPVTPILRGSSGEPLRLTGRRLC